MSEAGFKQLFSMCSAAAGRECGGATSAEGTLRLAGDVALPCTQHGAGRSSTAGLQHHLNSTRTGARPQGTSLLSGQLLQSLLDVGWVNCI